MSNEKFTPGEWVTRPGNTTVLDKKSTPIAMVYRAEYYRPKEESFANAALIKAAPEMYKFIGWLGSVEGQCAILTKDPEIVRKSARNFEKSTR